MVSLVRKLKNLMTNENGDPLKYKENQEIEHIGMFECFLKDKKYSGSSVIVTLFCFLEKINLMIINYCI
jgi:hypothetical protein